MASESQRLRLLWPGHLGLARGKYLTPVLTLTVSVYKRLQPGSPCGYWANWGHDHRGVTVRVPPARGQAPVWSTGWETGR